MTDQTLLITGPCASALCYGLVDTGKFIRIYPAERQTRPSMLFGHDDGKTFRFYARDNADKSSTTNVKKPDNVSQHVRNPQEKDGKIRKATPSKEFNAPVGEKRYDFAVRGSWEDVSAVMDIIWAHSREFEASEVEDNVIHVNCVGSPERTKVALNEIRQRL